MLKKILALCLVAVFILPLAVMAAKDAAAPADAKALKINTKEIDKKIASLNKKKADMTKKMEGLDKKIADATAKNKTKIVTKLTAQKDALAAKIAASGPILDQIIALTESQKTATTKEQLKGIKDQIKAKNTELKAAEKPAKK